MPNWINTDSFIDIDRWLALHYDICVGLALSDRRTTEYCSLHKDSPRDAFNVLLQAEPTTPGWAGLRSLGSYIDDAEALREAKKRYARYALGAYSPGFNVYLRDAMSFMVKNDPECCTDTPNVKYFPTLMEFIKTLPFSQIGRICFFVTEPHNGTPIHSDGLPQPHRNEFLWLRTSPNKAFFLFDEQTGEKNYIQSVSAFFDEKCFHGSDPSEGIVYALRIDGTFSDEFRSRLWLGDLGNYDPAA